MSAAAATGREPAGEGRSVLTKLMRWLWPEEKRLALDGGKPVHEYLDAYHDPDRRGEELSLNELAPMHGRLRSSLHRGADSDEVAVAAFLYAASRLPDCMPWVERVELAFRRPTPRNREGGQAIWQRVEAAKRRRLSYFDGNRRLVILVTSPSDLDDIIPGLIAFQIEWNKMHRKLAARGLGGRAGRRELRAALGLNRPDLEALIGLWGEDWERKIAAIATAPKDISVRMPPHEEADFSAMALKWWERVCSALDVPDLTGRPVYLVTSNNHSLLNLVSGFTAAHEGRISEYAIQDGGQEVSRRLKRLRGEEDLSARLNLLYYAQNGFLEQEPGLVRTKQAMEAQVGVSRTDPLPPLLAEAQVLELNRIDPRRLDPRLLLPEPKVLARSRAVVVNTDYPLGFSAFHLLEAAGRLFPDWRGLFILGKCASMIGRLGDVLIPTQVRDVHFHRLYSFTNCFSALHLAPYLQDAAVFDDQRSLTVHGTFLHSWKTVRNLHRADFTGIEMEAGPCLAALAGHFQPDTTGGTGLCHLSLPRDFLLGMLHYTSDTPYNLRASLLSQPLGLTGLEACYSASLAILQRILDQECGGKSGIGTH